MREDVVEDHDTSDSSDSYLFRKGNSGDGGGGIDGDWRDDKDLSTSFLVVMVKSSLSSSNSLLLSSVFINVIDSVVWSSSISSCFSSSV